MVELRSYQHDALLALFAYWREGGGNPLVDLPTGTGKSFLIAELSHRMLARQRRVLIVSHVREIIEQDAAAIRALWPDLPAGTIGINSAALGERDTQAPILLATVQSVFRNARELGQRSLMIVDEAHRVPSGSNGMYHAVIAGLRAIHPSMRVAGFTATPYRLDSGRLDEGDDKLFDKVVYSYGIADAIKDGWLSSLVAKGTDAEIDVTGVRIRGGEFIAGELERAATQKNLVERAADEIVHYGGQRQGWLAFCCSVNHARQVHEALARRGIACATVTAHTPDDERAQIIAEFRAARLRALVNCEVFTVGFDVPHVDLIALLRPTMSPGLYVQMAGRGTRLASGKQNCLLLDFAGNVMRHGPIDAVSVREEGERAKVKECPHCATLVAVGIRICPDCGYEWPVTEQGRPRSVWHEGSADLLSPLGNKLAWLPVRQIDMAEHFKPDRPPSLRIDFHTLHIRVSDWLAFEHSHGARHFAARKWQALGGREPVPLTAGEAIRRQRELDPISQIGVRRDGHYWRVVALRKQQLEKAS
jgi:DNA repair protein RadD